MFENCWVYPIQNTNLSEDRLFHNCLRIAVCILYRILTFPKIDYFHYSLRIAVCILYRILTFPKKGIQIITSLCPFTYNKCNMFLYQFLFYYIIKISFSKYLIIQFYFHCLIYPILVLRYLHT